MKSASESYKQAGVDITAGYRAVELMKKHVARTAIPGVLEGIGGFGGLFEMDLTGISRPVLVSGTDGRGHEAEDRLSDGQTRHRGRRTALPCASTTWSAAAPSPFSSSTTSPAARTCPSALPTCQGRQRGLRAGRLRAGGRRNRRMPGFYPEDEYDLAGFSVGVVDRAKILDREHVQAGDVLIALPSSGLHSNGFSLVRRVFDVEKPQFEHLFRGTGHERRRGF